MPINLKKPYEYIAHKDMVELAFDAMRGYLKVNKFQVVTIQKKIISKGIRLNIFLLGDHSGCTEEDWNNIISRVQQTIYLLLGPNAKLYAEPFSPVNTFYAQFKTYIAFKELW